MYQKTIVSVIIILFLNITCLSDISGKSFDNSKLTAWIKAEILKLGAGKHSFVKIKLKNKKKLKGLLSRISNDYFLVTDKKTNQTKKIIYSVVKQIRGRNKLSGKKIIAYGIIGTILILWAIRGN